MYRLARKTAKPSPEKAIRILAKRVVDWQEKHPAVGRCGSSEHYGISALERFLADLLQPEVQIVGAGFGCTTIRFQHNARSALADYFRDMAKKLSGRRATAAANVAENYCISARSLRRYGDNDLASDRATKSGRRAIERAVGTALEAEKKICAVMKKLAAG